MTNKFKIGSTVKFNTKTGVLEGVIENIDESTALIDAIDGEVWYVLVSDLTTITT